MIIAIRVTFKAEELSAFRASVLMEDIVTNQTIMVALYYFGLCCCKDPRINCSTSDECLDSYSRSLIVKDYTSFEIQEMI